MFLHPFICILFATHIVSYWATGFFYVYVYDQWSKDAPKVIKQVLINQFVYTPLYIIPFQYYPSPLSSLNVVWQLPAIVVLTDIIFYTVHRYFHYNKTLYTRIHLLHHQMDDPPVAVSALNAHPVEHLGINILSTVAPLFIVRANLIVAVVWTIIASVNVIIAHSATWPNDPHTVHHKYKAYNYGAGPLLLDRFFHSYKI